jgi:hypothetical protein
MACSSERYAYTHFLLKNNLWRAGVDFLFWDIAGKGGPRVQKANGAVVASAHKSQELERQAAEMAELAPAAAHTCPTLPHVHAQLHRWTCRVRRLRAMEACKGGRGHAAPGSCAMLHRHRHQWSPNSPSPCALTPCPNTPRAHVGRRGRRWNGRGQRTLVCLETRRVSPSMASAVDLFGGGSGVWGVQACHAWSLEPF